MMNSSSLMPIWNCALTANLVKKAVYVHIAVLSTVDDDNLEKISKLAHASVRVTKFFSHQYTTIYIPQRVSRKTVAPTLSPGSAARAARVYQYFPPVNRLYITYNRGWQPFVKCVLN